MIDAGDFDQHAGHSTVVLCPWHNHAVSMMFTNAFRGAEVWCPECGYRTSKTKDLVHQQTTPEIDARAATNAKRAHSFLEAMSFVAGSAERRALATKEERDRHLREIDEWKYQKVV